MIVAIGELQSADDRWYQPTYLPIHPLHEIAEPNAMHPLQNTRNKYYGLAQSVPIGRTNPPVPKAITRDVKAMGGTAPTYRVPDEWLRQYARGAQIANERITFYQTALKS